MLEESITFNIREYVEGSIRSILIKIFKITYTDPLIKTDSRNNNIMFADTK